MRFLNADPSGFSGGPNWFAYADGNPISKSDPFGLCAGKVDGGSLSRAQTEAANTFKSLPKPVQKFIRDGYDCAVDCWHMTGQGALGPNPEMLFAGLGNAARGAQVYTRAAFAADEAVIAAKGGMTLADDMAVLRQATTGKGNFGVGAAGADDAARLGRSWVGEGAEWSSSGKALVSPDGLRQFRPPSLKPNSPYATTGSQANFEWRNVPSGQWQGNGHLNITPP
jgi:hypothetical protein